MSTLTHRLAALLARRESRPARIERGIDHLHVHAQRLENRMATFEEAASELAQLTDDMADRLDAAEATNAELRAAVAGNDLQRAQELAAQAEQHTATVQAIADRLRGVGADASNPVPDTSPLPDPAPSTEDGAGLDEPGEQSPAETV